MFYVVKCLYASTLILLAFGVEQLQQLFRPWVFGTSDAGASGRFEGFVVLKLSKTSALNSLVLHIIGFLGFEGFGALNLQLEPIQGLKKK